MKENGCSKVPPVLEFSIFVFWAGGKHALYVRGDLRVWSKNRDFLQFKKTQVIV